MKGVEKWFWLIVVVVSFFACQETPSFKGFVALGDSYTAGTGIPDSGNFPNQLAKKLQLPATAFLNVSKNGWTTADLLDSLERMPENAINVEFITLMIGVNDQYDGVAVEEFLRNFQQLLSQISAMWGDVPVVVLSIPDYGITPFGMQKSATIAREIDRLNTLIETEVKQRGRPFYFIDITTTYRNVGGAKKYLAPDQLHPSALVYEKWVREILLVLGKV